MISEFAEPEDKKQKLAEIARKKPFIPITGDAVYTAVVTEPEELQKLIQLMLHRLPKITKDRIKKEFYRHLIEQISALGNGIYLIPNPQEGTFRLVHSLMTSHAIEIAKYLSSKEVLRILDFIEGLPYNGKDQARKLFGSLWKYLLDSKFFEAKKKLPGHSLAA